jgi:hypothetical protein
MKRLGVFFLSSPFDPEDGGSTYFHTSADFYRTARRHTRKTVFFVVTAVITSNPTKCIFMLGETGDEPGS